MTSSTAGGRLIEVSGAEALWLLEGTRTGRVMFTLHGVPAVRPAAHALEHGTLLVRSPVPVPALSMRDGGPAIVTFHADEIDPATGHGWSVTVTGPAEPLTDPDAAAHYRRVLTGWRHGPHDSVIRLAPHAVTGHRIGASLTAVPDRGNGPR